MSFPDLLTLDNLAGFRRVPPTDPDDPEEYILVFRGKKMIFDVDGVEILIDFTSGNLEINGVPVGAGSDAFDPTGTSLVATTKTAALIEIAGRLDDIDEILT